MLLSFETLRYVNYSQRIIFSFFPCHVGNVVNERTNERGNEEMNAFVAKMLWVNKKKLQQNFNHHHT